VLVLVVAALACDGKTRAPDLPPAQVYDHPVEVEGRWHGEVGGVTGELRVEELGDLRYRGMFEATTIDRRYVMNMKQVEMPAADGKPAPSNLVQFEWQDGHGDRGAGWLLVNREGSALTGTFGRGENNTDGAGAWTFVKRGTVEPPPDDDEDTAGATVDVDAES
jgi:hypothetical protein